MRSTSNIANICFNPPVITGPSVLVAEFSTGGVTSERPAGQFLRVLPDPVQDAITIVAPGMGSLKVTGLHGRVVLHSRQTDATRTLSIGSLACGTYLLLWESDHGARHHHSVHEDTVVEITIRRTTPRPTYPRSRTCSSLNHGP
jgi:hypothetical protein